MLSEQFRITSICNVFLKLFVRLFLLTKGNLIGHKPEIKGHFFQSNANQIQILKFEVCTNVALGSYFINPPQIWNLTPDDLLVMYQMRPNANLCFALAFYSVLSWCLRFTSYVCAVCSLPCSLILPSPLFLLIVRTDPSINQQRPPFRRGDLPCSGWWLRAWVAVCYAGPVHPNMAFLLTGITSVRSVSLKSRGRMSPWVMTLPSLKRKSLPFCMPCF